MATNRVPMYTGAGPSGTPVHPAYLVRGVLTPGVGEGVAGAFDLAPRPQDPVSDSIRLTQGGCIVTGMVQPWQGNYAYVTQGDWNSPPFGGNSTGSARYDMLVIRVEDTNFEGTRDLDTDDIIFQEIIPDVGPSAATLAEAGKPGYSAIPIARIRIGANIDTPNITASDITDLRELARPRTKMFQDTVIHPNGAEETLESDTYIAWPSTATWNVPVPPWAVEADFHLMLYGIDQVEVTPDGAPIGDIATADVGIEIVDENIRLGVQLHQGHWAGVQQRHTIGRGSSYDLITDTRDLRDTTITVRSTARDTQSADFTDTHFEADFATVAILQVFFRENVKLGQVA